MGGISVVRAVSARVLVAACVSATAVAVQVSATAGASAESSAWRDTGPLPAPRGNHTATVLANGKVLVAGGQIPGAESDGRTASALLYDPAGGVWSSTGSMQLARYRHTATLLANGKVLVAGGFSSDEGFSAELYDPETGTWSLTGPMVESRFDHTATLLPDGRVLVAAGRLFFTPTPTAEIYDPATGAWTSTGPMTTRRTDHVAVLMDRAPCGDLCGRVLVTGGQVEPDPRHGATVATNAAEVFDPSARTWSAIDVFHTARSHHTATLLANGKVLVAGGSTGNQSGPATDSARLFDPVTRSAISVGALAAARWDHAATRLPSGEVLVTGGTAADRQAMASAELYDPLTGTWRPAGSMGAARSNHTDSLLDTGDVLVAGGFDTASTELYGAALPVVSVGDVAVHEGDSGGRAATFTVSLSAPSAQQVTVAYATSDDDATAPGDYTAKTGTISFPPGTTSSTVKVPVAGDKVDEANETFTLGLSSPLNAGIGVGIGTGTIVDDDPPVVTGARLTIGDVSVHEGDQGARAAVFTVSLSKASTSYVTVSYATAKGSAVGTDFTARSGTLSFAPGTTTANVKVGITPDTIVEADEAFSVKLSGASGATITDSAGQGTVVDDD